MKRYLNIIAIGLLSMSLFSCKKDSFDYPEGTVGISKITIFPILTLSGDRYVTVSKGDAYTEAGAEAKAGEDPIEVAISGTVNTATPGVYTLTYSAANSDGFSATVSRTVVVYDTKPDAVGNDFTGSYVRAATGAAAIWEKIAPGVYLVTNPGGAPTGTGVVVVAINPTGSVISIPLQSTDTGSWKSNTENYNKASGVFSWAVENPGYGTAVRTFVKQ